MVYINTATAHNIPAANTDEKLIMTIETSARDVKSYGADDDIHIR